MSRQKTSAVYTHLEDLPRRGAEVVGVEFDDAEYFSGITFFFDDGSKAFCHTNLRSKIPDDVDKDSLEAQSIVDLVEFLYNTSSDEFSDDRFRDLVKEAFEYDYWEDSTVYQGSVARLVRFLLTRVQPSELTNRTDDPTELLETIGQAVKDAKVASRVAHRYNR